MSELREGEEGFVDRRGLRTIFGITLSRTEIDRREFDVPPRFPRRVKLGKHPNSRVFYVRSAIAEWVKAEIAKRDAQIRQDNSESDDEE